MAVAEGQNSHGAVHPRLYEDESYRQGFLATIDELRKAGVLQDVVLEVEGRRFPCNRLVLAAASSYFRAMFTGDMAESRQKTVVLQGLDPDILEVIITYIYSGNLHVSLDKVQPLYQAADLLQVDYVRDTCSSYMAMNVERSTCLDLYKFADTFSMENVKDRCLQCICRYFEEVSTTAEFCSLSVDQLTEIISQDWLDVKEETTVWEAVVRWVEHSTEDRQHYLPSILPHIRFNLMTSDDTAAILEHPFIREDPGSSAVIRTEVQRGTSNLKRRFGMDTEEMALVCSGSAKEMLFMNPRVGRYIKCSYTRSLPEAQYGSSKELFAMTVTSNNDIYALALESDDQWSLLLYNHFKNVWEHQSSLPGNDGHEFLFEVGGHLYYVFVFVGYDENILQVARARVRRYDQHTDQWHDCSQLQVSCKYVGVKAVSCGPHIYLITDAEMHRYDPTEDQWCKVDDTFPDIFPAVATGTELICDYMDDTGKISMWVYDTTSESLDELPALDFLCPAEASDIFNYWLTNSRVAFVLEDQLYLFIRYENKDYQTLAWQICSLDRATGVWTDLEATLPSGDWCMDRPRCHVARMYLPCLTANSTDEQNAANP